MADRARRARRRDRPARLPPPAVAAVALAAAPARSAIASESPEFVGLGRAADRSRAGRRAARPQARGHRAARLRRARPTPTRRQLRESLRTRFQWWAGAWALHPTRSRRAAAAQRRRRSACAAAGPLRRGALAAAAARSRAALAGPTLRVDLHPLDLASASHMLALEDVIRRATPTRDLRHLRRSGRAA